MPTSNRLTAAKAALKRLGIKRLGLVTPYRPDVTELMQARLDEAGIVIQSVGSFYQEDDTVVGRITPDAILTRHLRLADIILWMVFLFHAQAYVRPALSGTQKRHWANR